MLAQPWCDPHEYLRHIVAEADYLRRQTAPIHYFSTWLVKGLQYLAAMNRACPIHHQASTRCRSISNGELLRAAESAFDVLITTDQNLRHQQNLTGRSLAIVPPRARTWGDPPCVVNGEGRTA